jgi:hypothetical protein
VSQLERPGACLEEQWREDEEIRATDENDFGVRAPWKAAFEISSGGDACEPAAQNYDSFAH